MRRAAAILVCAFVLCIPVSTQVAGPAVRIPDRALVPDVVATFSILAYDPETGELGGAVLSRVFSAGTGVLWAEADVGVVTTQAIATARKVWPCGSWQLAFGQLQLPVAVRPLLVRACRDQRMRARSASDAM